MKGKLWGENYFDLKMRAWKTDSKPSDENALPLKRCFSQFMMDPIIKLIKVCINGEEEAVSKIINTLNIYLTAEEK